MPGVAAMVSLALALGGRRVALASLAVALVVVGRGGRAALGARRVARAALRRRLHRRLARPLFATVAPIVMLSTFPFPGARPVTFTLTVIPVIPETNTNNIYFQPFNYISE